MELSLKQAIERGELRLQYQPIVSLESGRITGFEGLLRWQHPELGLLRAAEFLPVAEQTQQMIPITRWVLREACRQVRFWQARFRMDPPLAVSVNLRLEYLQEEGRIEEVVALIQENDLVRYSFSLEITERQVMEDLGALSRKLLHLQRAGATFYVDNFGTAYSSLRLLAGLPVRGLKIDRYFANRLCDDAKTLAIVRWMISLSEALELEVIAKGIETAEQKDLLQRANCPYAQGYYFSPPVDPEAAARLLGRRVLAGGIKKVEISRLRPFELFAGFRDEELAEVAQACDELAIPSDTMIIRQGQVGSELYLLEEGSMRVYREQKDETRVLATLGAPTVFGEMALMNPERIRTASVKALSDSRVLAIHVGDFRALLRRFPELKTRLQQLIAERDAGR